MSEPGGDPCMGRFLSSAILSRFLAPIVGSCLRLVLIVRYEPERKFGSNTVRGELAIQRKSSRRILVFGRSYGDQNHDAVIRIGGEAPRRRAHSPYGAETMRYGGWPPPRIVLKHMLRLLYQTPLACLLISLFTLPPGAKKFLRRSRRSSPCATAR